ncbi:MAG: cell envelope integrity protein CreD [Bacteroides sp.]|nr:cell envelope integrity protein CreD [Bacteroides sp.]
MEHNDQQVQYPRYTMQWLGVQSLIIVCVAFILAVIVSCLDGFAHGRVESGLLAANSYKIISDSLIYCFGIIVITSLSIVLVEIVFRKAVNNLQYILIEMALALFYLLLVAMAEKMPFIASYIVVSAMTITLIALFVKGITRTPKAVALITAILAVEYTLMYILLILGSMALLVGSLSLFALIALAMYFTLKLRVENDELTLKK